MKLFLPLLSILSLTIVSFGCSKKNEIQKQEERPHVEYNADDIRETDGREERIFYQEEEDYGPVDDMEIDPGTDTQKNQVN